MIRLEDQKAVQEEIRLIVKEAKRDGQPVKADGLAKIVAWTYPHSGLTVDQIADRISEAAVAASVPVSTRAASRRSLLPAEHSAAA